MKQKLFSIIFLISSLAVFSPLATRAQDFSSDSFTVKAPIISEGSPTSTSSNFGLGQSLGQTAIGKSTSTNFQLWSGFQYFFETSANTLTATAGDGEVELSWTVPETFLGAVVGNYDVGTGTVSGSYTFESAGNVTSFTKDGLSNGIEYFFIVRAETAAGTFLVFSNEASATPAASTTNDETTGVVGSGGGGTPLPGAILEISGLASPQAIVTMLKDGQVAASTAADSGGNFAASLSGLSAGSYSFGTYMIDRGRTRSAIFKFSKTLARSVTETVDGIFLAPTLRASHTAVRPGESITLSGYTAPAASVEILLDTELVQRTASAADGAWSLALSTANLSPHTHTVQVRAVKAGQGSEFSDRIEFKVGETPIPVVEVGCTPSDINCDGLVNLVDFSIMLYYWEQPLLASTLADMNGDGIVNLTDFSILMYDWTG